MTDSKASPSPSVQASQLSFTQQLQQQAGQRGSRPRTAGLHLPLYSSSRILSPLSEPQSPLYASPPPPTPPNEPIWQPIQSTPPPSSLDRLVSSVLAEQHPTIGSSNNSQSRSSLSLLRRERSEVVFRPSSSTPPVPHRTSSVDADRSQHAHLHRPNLLKNETSSSRPSSVPLTQSSHMQIILGLNYYYVIAHYMITHFYYAQDSLRNHGVTDSVIAPWLTSNHHVITTVVAV